MTAAVTFRASLPFVVRATASGLTEDPDQDGDGDDRDDYENEQRNYSETQEIFLPARV